MSLYGLTDLASSVVKYPICVAKDVVNSLFGLFNSDNFVSPEEELEKNLITLAKVTEEEKKIEKVFQKSLIQVQKVTAIEKESIKRSPTYAERGSGQGSNFFIFEME